MGGFPFNKNSGLKVQKFRVAPLKCAYHYLGQLLTRRKLSRASAQAELE